MKAKRILFALVACYAVGTAVITGTYWYQETRYVKTDDAHVKTGMTVLTAPADGRIVRLDVRENQPVQANEIIGAVKNRSADASGGLVPLTAPAAGKVLRVGVREGEVVTADQPLLVIADLSRAYVEARLPEEDAARVRVGQSVDVRLDAHGGHRYGGVVSQVGSATEQKLSPLVSLGPAQKTPKESQLVPVKIRVTDTALIPGTSAFVTIHIGGGADERR